MTVNIRSILALALAGLPHAVVAQGSSDIGALVEAFSGTWYSFDTDEASLPCRIELEDGGSVQPLPATSSDCAGVLSEVGNWTIAEGQIRLLAGTDGPIVARLGGNQFRITGETAPEGFLVLEREQGDPNSRAVREAITTYRCIYRGFTDTCATREELAVPAFSGDAPTEVTMLVNLNVRQQPRADSGLIGVVEAGSTVALETCLVTSDGPWCAAQFGDEIGWLARTTLRLDTWPVMTFSVAP